MYVASLSSLHLFLTLDLAGPLFCKWRIHSIIPPQVSSLSSSSTVCSWNPFWLYFCARVPLAPILNLHRRRLSHSLELCGFCSRIVQLRSTLCTYNHLDDSTAEGTQLQDCTGEKGLPDRRVVRSKLIFSPSSNQTPSQKFPPTLLSLTERGGKWRRRRRRKTTGKKSFSFSLGK